WAESIGKPPPGSTGIAAASGPYGGDGLKSSSGVVAPSPFAYDAFGKVNAGASTRAGLNTVGRGAGANRSGGVQSRVPPNNSAGITAAHVSAPYIAWHEEISYEINNHIVAFSPKSLKANTILQQPSAPTVHVIQAGYCIRDGALTDRPLPPAPI